MDVGSEDSRSELQQQRRFEVVVFVLLEFEFEVEVEVEFGELEELVVDFVKGRL